MKGFRQPSTMGPSHAFSTVPQAQIQRSAFKRSRGYKTTFDSAYLVPVFLDEVLPGDTYSVRVSSVVRMLSALGLPIMDNLHLDFFFFFTPCRLLWDDWEHFCGAKDDPDDDIDWAIPQITAPVGGWLVGSLGDYFGLPTEVNGLTVSSLPFRAYNRIYNDWFRHEGLIAKVNCDTDGSSVPADYVLLKRSKRHDYFTSCMPWPQLGEAVDLPLGTVAPVITGDDISYSSTERMRMWRADTGGYSGSTRTLGVEATTGDVMQTTTSPTGAGYYYQPSNLWADLQNATAATVNSLREAFQLQVLLERDARSGTRYVEMLKAHFGVTSPDFRLQRPEYLGGGTTPVTIQPVAQQSESGTTPQGTLAGVAYQSAGGIGFTKSFVEHGYIIGIINVRADLTYQQGVNRLWRRYSRFDFYYPALAHLGEQEVLNEEIYCDGSANDALVFGYQERWAEYRYAPSLITGALRSSYATSLDVWHLSQDFASLPVLNQSFIEEAPPIDRVVAVQDENEFVGDFWFDVTCTRPMPTYSVPGLIDHF